MKALYCHASVITYLRATTAEAPPGPLGSIGGLFGIPVIENPDLELGEWQARDNGEVLDGGHLFRAPEPQPFMFESPPFTFEHAKPATWQRDYLRSMQFMPVPPLIVTSCA